MTEWVLDIHDALWVKLPLKGSWRLKAWCSFHQLGFEPCVLCLPGFMWCSTRWADRTTQETHKDFSFYFHSDAQWTSGCTGSAVFRPDFHSDCRFVLLTASPRVHLSSLVSLVHRERVEVKVAASGAASASANQGQSPSRILDWTEVSERSGFEMLRPPQQNQKLNKNIQAKMTLCLWNEKSAQAVIVGQY